MNTIIRYMLVFLLVMGGFVPQPSIALPTVSEELPQLKHHKAFDKIKVFGDFAIASGAPLVVSAMSRCLGLKIARDRYKIRNWTTLYRIAAVSRVVGLVLGYSLLSTSFVKQYAQHPPSWDYIIGAIIAGAVVASAIYKDLQKPKRIQTYLATRHNIPENN